MRSMLKRLAVTDFDWEPCYDLCKTSPGLLQHLCDRHFFSLRRVTAPLQALWDGGFTLTIQKGDLHMGTEVHLALLLRHIDRLRPGPEVIKLFHAQIT